MTRTTPTIDQHAHELYRFLDRALPWLAKAKADGTYDNVGGPKVLDRLLEEGYRLRSEIEDGR